MMPSSQRPGVGDLDSLMDSFANLNTNEEGAEELASLLKQKLQLKPRSNDDELYRQLSKVLMNFNINDNDEQPVEVSPTSDGGTQSASCESFAAKENAFDPVSTRPTRQESPPLQEQQQQPAAVSHNTTTTKPRVIPRRRHRRGSSNPRLRSPPFNTPRSKSPFSKKEDTTPPAPSATTASRSARSRSSSPWRRMFGRNNSNQDIGNDDDVKRSDNGQDNGVADTRATSTQNLQPQTMENVATQQSTPTKQAQGPVSVDSSSPIVSPYDRTPQRCNKNLRGPVSVDSPPVTTFFPTPPSTGDFPTPLPTGSTNIFSPEIPIYNNNTESPVLSPMVDAETPASLNKSAPPTGKGKMRRKTATPTHHSAVDQQTTFSMGASPTTMEKRAKLRAKRGSRNRWKPNVAAAASVPMETSPPVPPKATTRFTAPDMTPPCTVKHSVSPSDMDFDLLSPQMDDITFSIGKGDKKKSPGVSPGISRRRSRMPRRQQRGPTTMGLFTSSSPVSTNNNVEMEPKEVPTVASNVSSTTTQDSNVDHSGAIGRVSSLRDQARVAYVDGKYTESIQKYTEALAVSLTGGDEIRARIYANRAAALLMIGAFEAAVADCERALVLIVETSEGGYILKCRVYNRLGKSLLRMGKLEAANAAFHRTELTVNAASRSDEYRQGGEFTQVTADATLGKTEAQRCLEAKEVILRCSPNPSVIPDPLSSDRMNKLQALAQVDIALNIASGDPHLHEKKVALLGSLKKWRDIITHCEPYAAQQQSLDNVFIGDELAASNPFPGVAPAKSLCASFFQNAAASDKKLNPQSVAEAVLRLPHAVLPWYLRALRLEERYPQAEAGIRALEDYTRQQKELRTKFLWLSSERDKVNRTMSEKDRGDTLYRKGDFARAAAQYALCCTIDDEGNNRHPIEGAANAGGRVHAVLHCNRAACQMAMDKYHEAIGECTAALRIHPYYMKAMLRRARCYARLKRSEESIAEYERWLQLVKDAKNESEVPNTPCRFDLPGDVSAEDEKKVKQELTEVVSAKRQAESAARSAANNREERQRRHNSETYGSTSQGDAYRRRERWHSQQGNSSRRWDSFRGRGPGGSSYRHPSERREDERSNSRQREQQNSNSSRRQQQSQEQPPRVNSPIADANHYLVLGVRRDASKKDIKRAYRRLALKYHPDKNNDAGAVEKFRLVTQAYEILGDEGARRKYDSKLRFSRRH